MFRTILAGCDGYERGRAGVAFAANLGRANGARPVLATTYHDPPLPYPTGYREHKVQVERLARATWRGGSARACG